MSKARLVITAIEVEGRSPAEVVAAYGVSRSWVYELLARYRAEGEAAFQPRSRRPHSSPGSTPAPIVELVLRIRKQLSDAGLDAGAETPCAWPADCTTSASAEPTPEPTSCYSSRTCTSASSTPPPASSSATSSSIPARTTSPPVAHPAQPANDKRPNPQSVGSGVRDVLRHHSGRGDRI